MGLRAIAIIALVACAVNIRQTDVLDASFSDCDRDGSLGLDSFELDACLESLRGLPEDESWAQTLVMAYDSDGNGSLESAEWETLWQQNYAT